MICRVSYISNFLLAIAPTPAKLPEVTQSEVRNRLYLPSTWPYCAASPVASLRHHRNGLVAARFNTSPVVMIRFTAGKSGACQEARRLFFGNGWWPSSCMAVSGIAIRAAGSPPHPTETPSGGRPKFEGNIARDRRDTRRLVSTGWAVIILWECGLREVEGGRRSIRWLLDRIRDPSVAGQALEWPASEGKLEPERDPTSLAIGCSPD